VAANQNYQQQTMTLAS